MSNIPVMCNGCSEMSLVDGKLWCERYKGSCEEHEPKCEQEFVVYHYREDIVKALKEYWLREFEGAPEKEIENLGKGKEDEAGVMYTEAEEGSSIEWLKPGTPLQVTLNIKTLEVKYYVDDVLISTEKYSDPEEFIEDNLKNADFQGWYGQIMDVVWAEGDKARDIIEQAKKRRTS